MGRLRGPKPKPSAIKRLQGNPGKRKIKDDPKALVLSEVPDPPKLFEVIENKKLKEWMTDEWYRLAGALVEMGALTILDLHALAMYCFDYARYLESANNLSKTGSIIKTKNQNWIYSPIFSQTNVLEDKLKSLGSLFGLNPSERGRLNVPEKEKGQEEEIENFLKAGKKLKAVK